MSTLGSSNISWDAIGDVFQNFGNASNNNGRSGSYTVGNNTDLKESCLLYTSPSPRD